MNLITMVNKMIHNNPVTELITRFIFSVAVFAGGMLSHVVLTKLV